MSSELDDLSVSLFNGFLPSVWRRLAPQTEKKLGSWMSHFQGRVKLYSDWINIAEPNVVWLSGLHIPESYLTALVQTTCRAKGWALDKSMHSLINSQVHSIRLSVRVKTQKISRKNRSMVVMPEDCILRVLIGTTITTALSDKRKLFI